MPRRSNARGHVELRGPTWWLTRSALVTDRQTGEIRRRTFRERLGPKTEIRSRAAARARADQWLAQLAPEQLVPGPRILAVQYFEYYIKTHAALMRTSSLKKYRAVIRVQIAPAFAGLAIAEIDSAMIRELIARLTTRYRRNTVQSIRGVLLQVLRQAARDGYGARRIDAREVRLPKANVVEPERPFFTTQQLDLILDSSDHPRRALWAVMGLAGLRVGEALGLCWSHVDFERQILKIRQSAMAGKISPVKTGASAADLPILAPLAAILADYRRAWRPNAAGLLFATRRGTPLATDYVRRYWLQPLLASLGLPRAGCHAFRHGLPGRLSQAGVSTPVIQKIMRHATAAMTERYLHTRVEDIWHSLNAAGLGKQNAAPTLQTLPPAACEPVIQAGA